jgi:HSP20 family protein
MPRTKLARRPTTFTPFFPSPFAESAFPSMTRLMDEITERMNDDFPFTGLTGNGITAMFPAVNVSETKDEYTMTAELPGMTVNDVKVDFTDGVLTIQGEKEEKQEEKKDDRKYYMWERRYGSFQRSFPFPGGIVEGKIGAEFKDGILTVHLPKAEELKAEAKKIPIVAK